MAVRGYNQFILVDSSHQPIAECYTANDLTDYSVPDALPSTIQSRVTTEGYIYCKTSINTLPIIPPPSMILINWLFVLYS